jgi:hypothetical protein
MVLFFWLVNNTMRLQAISLVDVTETREKRDGDTKKYSQQSNFNSLVQTINIRANMIPISCEKKSGGISQYNLGENFKNKHNYWIVTFESEREVVAIDESTLIEDFELVPVNLNLDETAKISQAVFDTSDKNDKNISFIFDV